MRCFSWWRVRATKKFPLCVPGRIGGTQRLPPPERVIPWILRLRGRGYWPSSCAIYFSAFSLGLIFLFFFFLLGHSSTYVYSSLEDSPPNVSFQHRFSITIPLYANLFLLLSLQPTVDKPHRAPRIPPQLPGSAQKGNKTVPVWKTFPRPNLQAPKKLHFYVVQYCQ